MSLWGSYYCLLPRQQGRLSQGLILHSEPWKLSLNWLSRIVFVLFMQSLAEQSPACDQVLMCSGVVKGQIPMSKMNLISYCKALSSPCLCSDTEKILVCLWLFGAHTHRALSRLFNEAVSYFCLQTALVTLLNIAPLIITIFQHYQSHCDCFLVCFSCISMTDTSILKNYPFMFQPEYQYLRNKQVILLIEDVCAQKAFYFLLSLVF